MRAAFAEVFLQRAEVLDRFGELPECSVRFRQSEIGLARYQLVPGPGTAVKRK